MSLPWGRRSGTSPRFGARAPGWSPGTAGGCGWGPSPVLGTALRTLRVSPERWGCAWEPPPGPGTGTPLGTPIVAPVPPFTPPLPPPSTPSSPFWANPHRFFSPRTFVPPHPPLYIPPPPPPTARCPFCMPPPTPQTPPQCNLFVTEIYLFAVSTWGISIFIIKRRKKMYPPRKR